MPMTTTHALVPLAGFFAFADRPVNWRLAVAAAVAAALPDVDSLAQHFLRLAPGSIYAHRGAGHSLFVAMFAGLIASMFHKPLRTAPAVAGLVIGASMASHSILDMMTDTGAAVAALWPLSSARVFADWRPFHGVPVWRQHALELTIMRLRIECWQILLPLIGASLAIRTIRAVIRSPKRATPE